MSTRSGKKIHNAFHEIPAKAQVEYIVQSERKTRSRRVKEIGEELSASVVKPKKRTNYVAYPTDDEVSPETVNSKAEEAKPTRSLRNNALKELNVLSSDGENSDTVPDTSKQTRTTRRTQKLEDDAENVHLNHEEEVINIGKTKKTKQEKKKKSIEQKELPEVSKKKTKKKLKKGKQPGSMVVEDINPQDEIREGLNKSNMSVESFHSAAGSPVKSAEENVPDTICQEIPEHINLKLVNKSTEMPTIIPEARLTRHTRSAVRNTTLMGSQNFPNTTIKKTRKRKSSANLDNSTSGDQNVVTEFDTTLTNASKKRKSSVQNKESLEKNGDETFDKETQNSTSNLEDLEKRKSEIKAALVNTTYDKSEPKLDTTSDKNEIDDKNTTYDKESPEISTSSAKKQTPPAKLNSTFEKDKNNSHIDLKTNTAAEKPALDTTFEKDKSNKTATRKSEIINTTYEKDCDQTNSIGTPKNRKSSIVNLTYDKDNISSDSVIEIEASNRSLRTQTQSPKINSTFDKNEKSKLSFNENTKSDTTFEKNEKSDTTYDKNDKLDATFDKVSKSSLISSDNSTVRDSTITLDKSDISRISITSDDSKENIMNATPVLIESSLDESKVNKSKISPKSPTITVQDSSVSPQKGSTSEASPKTPTPVTPLKREGTFTKEVSDMSKSTQKKLSMTPTRKMSLPSPGCTPFPGSKSGTSIMNVTRSLEKSRRSSLTEPLPRATRVMFCSPANNPAVVMQQRNRVIKSNLKGSNKSFVFEEEVLVPRAAPRKRSYTHSEAEEARAKRTRLDPAPPVRAARTRTASAGHAVPAPSVVKPSTPKRGEARISRTKLPNFAALHRKEFSKMESLDECQERRARRAKQLLTPTGAVTVLDRSTPRESIAEPEKKKSPNQTTEQPAQAKSKKSKGKDPLSSKKDKDPQPSKKDKDPQPSKKDKDSQPLSKKEKEAKKPETPVKSLPTLKSLNPGYTRFGFKLNYDVNPFSIPTNPNASLMFTNKKNTIKKDNTKPLKELKAMKRHSTMPALAGVSGATSRKEIAKQTVMREKSFPDKRSLMRNETRTVIKGVRTNRRFELQMRMRNID